MSSAPRPTKRPFLSCAECAICFEAYDLDTRFPVMGNCGHTICAACRSRLPKTCPICQKKNAFVHETKNFSLIQMIEEKLSEAKRQKTDSGCSLCQKPVDDADSHVCLECVQKKDCKSLEDLMKEVHSLKMCSRCAEEIQKHDGHESHKLCDAKSGLYSMDLTMDVESLNKKAMQRLGEFHTTCQIVSRTYKAFYNTCHEKGRMVGSVSELTVVKKSIVDGVARLHKALMANDSNLWKLTNECLKTIESVAKEKWKRQGRQFTATEDSTLRALLATTRRQDSKKIERMLLEEGKANVTTKDWMNMTFKENKTKALEMLQERGGSEGNEDEEVGTTEENGGGTE